MVRLFTFLAFICLNSQVIAQALTKDANTLLLLNFDNTLMGADGEVPVQSQNISYQDGVFEKALYLKNNTTLRYDTTKNLNTTQGTIEFWIKPEMPGRVFDMRTNAGGMSIGVGIGEGKWTVMDINYGVPDLARSVIIPNLFEENIWYNLAFTWDENAIKLYKNGNLVGSTPVGYLPPRVNSTSFSISSQFSNEKLVGLMDEFRISDKARSGTEIFETYIKGKNIKIGNIHLTDSNPVDLYKTWKIYFNKKDWWKTPEVFSIVDSQKVFISNSVLKWSVDDTTKAKFINGDLVAIDNGSTVVRGKLLNLEVSFPINILKPIKEPEYIYDIDDFLTTPASCHQKLMPVVMIAYFPTKDGIHLDRSEVDKWFPEDISLVEDAKKRVISIAKDTKYMLEEGSKFRGYKESKTTPYLGYKVIDIIFVYEPVPRNLRIYNDGPYTYLFEPYNVLERFDGSNYVNNLNVKEFWVYQVGMDSVNFPESNMSSPTTGDVSNSFRINDDLPVYDQTYVWYGHNYSRVGNEAVHNHLHQIETMFLHANWLQEGNIDLFWKKFAGFGPNFENAIGRSGWTHFPPNGIKHYDYFNTTLVDSDIMDWLPEGGKKTPVNKETWEKFNFKWPKNLYTDKFGNVIDHYFIHSESYWYVTLMQSFLGYGNQVPYTKPANSNRIHPGYQFQLCTPSCDHDGKTKYKTDVLEFSQNKVIQRENNSNASSRSTMYFRNWWDMIYDWDNFYDKGLYSDTPQPTPKLCNVPSTTIYIDKEICGAKDSEIKVPVRVKDYENIAGLQFRIASLNSEIAEIVGVADINPISGLSQVDFAIVNKKLVLTYADAAKSMTDDEALFSIRVELKGELNSKDSLFFEGDIFALDNNGSKQYINVSGGTICIKKVTSALSGNIATPTNKSLKDIKVNVSNAGTVTKTTNSDLNGNYVLPDILNDLNYTLTPSHTDPIANGIDISDLFLLRRHMQGVSLLTNPYTYIAADMNRDKNIDISDLFILRRIMQGLVTQLPDNVNTWRFVPKTHTFLANPLSGTIPDHINYNPLTENKVDQNFIGVKYGDLDHSSASFQNQQVTSRNATVPELILSETTASSGSIVEVEISAKNFTKAAVMQFSISWPKDKLELETLPGSLQSIITGTTSLDQTEINNGKLGLIWETDNFTTGTTMPDKTVFYKLRFKILGPNNSSVDLINSKTPKSGKLIFATGESIDLEIKPGKVTIEVPSHTPFPKSLYEVQIYPNPSTGLIHISGIDAIKKVDILSLTGQTVIKDVRIKDQMIDLSDLQKGIYYLKIHSDYHLSMKKVLLVK